MAVHQPNTILLCLSNMWEKKIKNILNKLDQQILLYITKKKKNHKTILPLNIHDPPQI